MCRHGACVVMVYVLSWCMCRHGVCVVMVYVLSWCVCRSGVCVVMVYVLSRQKCIHVQLLLSCCQYVPSLDTEVASTFVLVEKGISLQQIFRLYPFLFLSTLMVLK